MVGWLLGPIYPMMCDKHLSYDRVIVYTRDRFNVPRLQYTESLRLGSCSVTHGLPLAALQ